MTDVTSGPGAPTLSVIIPAYNAADTLEPCLQALLKSDRPAHEIIIVDDGSTDDTPRIAVRHGCRLIRLPGNSGPSAARNRGSQPATGEVLFFLDADVLVQCDTLTQIGDVFAHSGEVSALFGSYGTATVPDNFCSVYKNLLHHYTHQQAREEAVTFCGGFGAIRRHVFEQLGGFDERLRFMEDVDLGHRMHLAGFRIRLVKSLQFTHCKVYSFWGLVRSDVVGRAIPWTKLMLRNRVLQNDLNTRSNNVLSVVSVFLTLLLIPLAFWLHVIGFAILGLLVLFVIMNWPFQRWMLGQRGLPFMLQSLAMQWIGYLYSGIGLMIGVFEYARERLGTTRPRQTERSTDARTGVKPL